MDNREKLIHKVLSSSYLGVMSLFVNFSKELENVRFVFFDNEIGTKLPHYHHIVGNKMSILSVNDDQNFLIFDKKRVQEMLENKQTDFNYDNCVNFDTQVLRYLKELLEKKNVSQNPQVQKLHELLCFLMLKHVDYSCFPYVFENSSKLSSPEILDGVRNNLYAYFYFKSLGLEEYKEVISSYSPVKYSQMIIDQVEEHLSVIQKAKNPEYKDLFLQMKVIQCLLLKVITIKLKSKEGIRKKFEKLMEFVNLQLGVFMEREVAICYLYLKNDKRVQRFFKKIQVGAQDITGAVLGMAWDLFHIRLLAISMRNNTTEEVPFEMHSLVTFDKGLRNVLLAYPVRSIAFEKNRLPIWHFKNRIQEFIPEYDFNDIHEEQRKEAFNKANFDKLIENLEEEVTKLTKTAN